MINSHEHLRKILRIAIAATIGLVISKVADLDDWGVFYAVLPTLMLGLAPRFNGFVALQTLSSSVVTASMLLVYNLLQHHQLVFVVLFFIIMLSLFRCMAKGMYMLFGATSVLNTNIFLHFGSYPDMAFAPMAWANVLSVCVSILVCSVVLFFLPQRETPQPPPAIQKPIEQVRHQALLGAVITTISFVVFQVADLRDSLSAQATTILILLPMTLSGVLVAGIKRAKGTLLGSSYAIVIQLILFTQYTHVTLSALAFFIGMLLFARVHHLEGPGSGVAFGGMTTLCIIFGQYLKPEQDLIYSALYRISSVAGAVVITLTLVYLLHLILNRFDSTRYVVDVR
ncbi:DUF2955 domain-containing protein [Pokkaliibacter sp. CJK22405]|uniref:DUF2955 domain-containing protein n=1 Tax=Pokkaliibacter sp. CJK22405 TaxID=3384615 RepID=UPI003984D68C